MATVNNWIDHLTAASKAEGGAAGPIFPGAGSEGILVIILVIIWIGWTVISSVSYTHLTLPTKPKV